ncbi:MAG TPA: helix-turn-helix domain-containing protein [Microbacteriaceae bacterium]|nr:helix-turn-helix domain-containing protein [Microbacteriaceae bacterium]
MTGDPRGILYPARLPTFHREPVPAELDGLVRWYWIPRWDLAPGRTSRQEILPFPAANLVVSPEGIALVGPATGASHRDLRGRGWAVGALLRPAGLASLVPDPRRIRDAETSVDAPELHAAVRAAMALADEDAGRNAAVAAYSHWLVRRLVAADAAGRLANRMEDLVAADRDLVRVDQLAERLRVGVRTVQRLAARYVGLPPLALIRRYRLQEVAQRLREDPKLAIAQVAAELGYSDQAHLARDFRQVLGVAPGAFRRDRPR